MASAVASLDSSSVNIESLWRLVFEIQSATIHLWERAATHSSVEALESLVRSHPLVQILDAVSSPPVALTLRASPDHTPSAESLIDLFTRWLGLLEEHQERFVQQCYGSAEVFDALRRGLHGYLNATMQGEVQYAIEQQRTEQAVYNFAYGLSHEINNPLANIAARASQLAKEAKNASHTKSLTVMVDSAMKAHEMIAEMMLAVQQPAIALKQEELRAILVAACHRWQELASDRQILWEANIDDEYLPCRIDRTSLLEAVSAVVRNAIDACRPGDSVKFVASRVAAADGQVEIRLAVMDSGLGLTDAQKDQAWDLFYCGREAGRGLGIGLAKVRRVIEAHGGAVWLDSKFEAGCTVEMRLPWSRSKPRA